jgi:predicted DsbA family dithiol-disulfide isomerase
VGLERAAWLKRRYGADIEVQPFDLHPEYPPEGIPREESERRYSAELHDAVRHLISDAGLPKPNLPPRIPNASRALALTAYAGAQGLAEPLHDRLFRDYWAEGRDLLDDRVLLDAAQAVGLDRSEAATALADPTWREQVAASTARALSLGIGGVPAWVIDRRVLIPGAQPHEVFTRVLHKLGHEPIASEAD